MPPLPPVERGLLIRIKGLLTGGVWNNVLHAQYAGTTPTEADLTTLAGSIATLWDTHIGQKYVASVTITGVDVIDIGRNDGAGGLWAGTALAGANPGVAQPANVALVISWKVARRFRGGHCRSYIPGVPDGVLSDPRNVTQAHADALRDGALAFRTAFNALTTASTGQLTLVMVSYFSKTLNPTPPHLRPTPRVDPILAAAVGRRMDSQRRRLGKST